MLKKYSSEGHKWHLLNIFRFRVSATQSSALIYELRHLKVYITLSLQLTLFNTHIYIYIGNLIIEHKETFLTDWCRLLCYSESLQNTLDFRPVFTNTFHPIYDSKTYKSLFNLYLILSEISFLLPKAKCPLFAKTLL